MLERVDRMQLAVSDVVQAEQTFEQMLDAQVSRRDTSQYLNARRTIMSIGDSELELCEPMGAGVAKSHLDDWGEGLLCAGFATRNLDAFCAHLNDLSAAYHRDGDQVYIDADTTFGLPVVVSPMATRERHGPVNFLYEATNTLKTDWQIVAQRYVELFALNPDKFSRIGNTRFGYQGSLTLFDPPARLDRIELSQTFADQPGAMRRFVERRGDSLYMCFIEAHDFPGLKGRLLAAGAKLTPRGSDLDAEQDTVWVHPRHLHGMLLGISRPGFAWTWSGRPEIVPSLG